MRKPEWLRIPISCSENKLKVEAVLERLALHTVCAEARCPNAMECHQQGTATFMILGANCTRNCTFCKVTKATPSPVDSDEPRRVAEAVRELGLKHVVITSVTRDDLADGGARHFREVITAVRKDHPTTTIEVLIPDFQGDLVALETVIEAGPEIINHNLETAPRLYPEVRALADYHRSLELLRRVKEAVPEIMTKSGMMVGLGETEAEVMQVCLDLRTVGCDLLTIGQYLAPSQQHHPVIEYLHPEIFEKYRTRALAMGFKHVASAPLVRSSYHASEVFVNFQEV